MKKTKPYLVTYEYEDETKYMKMIPARSEDEAMKFIESKITGSTAIKAEEVEE